MQPMGTSDWECLWTLRRGDDEVRCEACLLPVGIEGRIVWNGRELYAFRFTSGEELLAWAREKRNELLDTHEYP